jgi:hypothetical protein
MQKQQLAALIADRERALILEKRAHALRAAEHDVQRLRARVLSLEHNGVANASAISPSQQQPHVGAGAQNAAHGHGLGLAAATEDSLVALAAALARQARVVRWEGNHSCHQIVNIAHIVHSHRKIKKQQSGSSTVLELFRRV